MEEKSLHINGYNNRHFSNKLFCVKPKNNKLAIMFPGIGYTNDKPVLYFTKQIFLQKGYDVLDLDFDYLKNKEFLFYSHYRKEIVFEEDVEGILTTLSQLENYDEIIFNAKSIGTKAMSLIHSRLPFENIKIIWQTPLLNDEFVLNEMISTKHKSLAIIGTRDPHYKPNLIKELLKNRNFTFFEIDDLNHSYDCQENVFLAIEKSKLIIHRIDDFIYI